MRADERLRDVVDAEPEREVEVGEVLLRQRRHRQRDAGDVHALVRLDHAAGHDLAERPLAVESLDAQADVAVVDEDLVARPRAPRRARRARPGGRPSRRRPGRDDDGLADLELRRAVEVADPDLRPLEVGDERERTTAAACTARARRALSSWSACVPCEKLSRTPSIPASTSAASVSSSFDAGPIVATIFVRRSGCGIGSG